MMTESAVFQSELTVIRIGNHMDNYILIDADDILNRTLTVMNNLLLLIAIDVEDEISGKITNRDGVRISSQVACESLRQSAV